MQRMYSVSPRVRRRRGICSMRSMKIAGVTQWQVLSGSYAGIRRSPPRVPCARGAEDTNELIAASSWPRRFYRFWCRRLLSKVSNRRPYRLCYCRYLCLLPRTSTSSNLRACCLCRCRYRRRFSIALRYVRGPAHSSALAHGRFRNRDPLHSDRLCLPCSGNRCECSTGRRNCHSCRRRRPWLHPCRHRRHVPSWVIRRVFPPNRKRRLRDKGNFVLRS